MSEVGALDVVLIALAVPTTLWFGMHAFFAGLALYGRCRHRLRVREAIRQGWTQPAMPRNWKLLDSGSGIYGVSAVESSPDHGVTISEYTAHARAIQREVETAWLEGIDRGRVAHDIEPAAPITPTPPPVCDGPTPERGE